MIPLELQAGIDKVCKDANHIDADTDADDEYTPEDGALGIITVISILMIPLELQASIEKVCKDANHTYADTDADEEDEDTPEDRTIRIHSNNVRKALNLPE